MSDTENSHPLAPELRFAGFNTDWNRREIGDMAKIKHGYAFKGEFFTDSGSYVVLTPGNFQLGGGFRYQGDKEKFYSDPNFPKDYILQKGDLVTAMTEQAVGLIGSPLVVPEDGKFLHNQRLGLFQFAEGQEAGFLYFSMQTTSMRREFSNSAAGSKVRHTSPKRIESLPLRIPTLPEQRKIADFLTAVDGRIGQLIQKKALLEDYKKGVMQRLFAAANGELSMVNDKCSDGSKINHSQLTTHHFPALRFKDDQGNDFPDWEEKKFEDIFLFSTGKNIKQAEASPDFATPCVRYGELYHMYDEIITTVVNSTNIDHSDLVFSDGDEILLPSAGEDPLDIGAASALTIKGVAIGRTINVLKPKKHGVYEQKFASYYINHRLRKKISTLARGASISNVYNSDLKPLDIQLPSLLEQTKIANFLSALDRKIESVATQITETQTFKRGLLQQMFV